MKIAGIQLVVPLVTHGELIGWLGLGPRLMDRTIRVISLPVNEPAIQAAPQYGLRSWLPNNRLSYSNTSDESRNAGCSRIQHAYCQRSTQN